MLASVPGRWRTMPQVGADDMRLQQLAIRPDVDHVWCSDVASRPPLRAIAATVALACCVAGCATHSTRAPSSVRSPTVSAAVSSAAAPSAPNAVAVPSAVTLSLDAEPAINAPGQATITASLPGLPAADLASATVEVGYGSPAKNVHFPLTFDPSTGTFAATHAVPAGGFVTIDGFATVGDRRLEGETGIELPDNSATIGHLTGDRIVETATGLAQALRLQIPVTVARADSYRLVVTLTTAAGRVTPGGVTANLPAGASTLTLDIPIEDVLIPAVDGPYEVTDASLTEGFEMTPLVATAADLGATAAYHIATILPYQTVLSTFTLTGVDTNGDGRYDVLRVSGGISTTDVGIYDLTGTLFSPAFKPVDQIDQFMTLHAGYNPVSFDIDGHLVTANGSGQYGLDLALQGDITTNPLPDTGDILADLNATQWAGHTSTDAPTAASPTR
jgi:hypothetical protein